MPSLAIIFQSIVRYLLVMGLTWLVAKGIITKEQSDAALPSLIGSVLLISTFIGAIFWSYFQKWYNGWIKQNPQIANEFALPFRPSASTLSNPPSSNQTKTDPSIK